MKIESVQEVKDSGEKFKYKELSPHAVVESFP